MEAVIFAQLAHLVRLFDVPLRGSNHFYLFQILMVVPVYQKDLSVKLHDEVRLDQTCHEALKDLREVLLQNLSRTIC